MLSRTIYGELIGLKAQDLQNQINELDYWDRRVVNLICNHFADEVIIEYDFEDGQVVNYTFAGCYKANFDHCLTYDKPIPSKQLTYGQIPYFLQEVVVDETEQEKISFYRCKINMFPLYLEIWCKEITVTVQPTPLIK